MKILITGANGMLAQAVKARFGGETDKTGTPKNELVLTDAKELDITNASRVFEVVGEVRPDVLINCAAYTAVDKAETQAELAFKINADGPGNLARACKEVGATLVHISTDYVFGGAKPVTEEYSEDDEKNPQTVYGKTKLGGEEQIVASGCNYYIFRTAWLYGEGPNFIRTMLELSKTHDELRVVNDQYGSPTSTETLTSIIWQALDKKIPFGIYNATNQGFTNWYEFAKLIFELANKSVKVVPVSSEEYAAPAPRPKNSKMSKKKLLDLGIEIPDYRVALKQYLEKE